MPTDPLLPLHRDRGGHQGRRNPDALHRQRVPGVAQGRDRPGDGSRRRGRDDVPQDDCRALSRITPSLPRSSARTPRRAARRTAGCSIRSTARTTTRTACRFSARRWRSRSTAKERSAPIYDPTRKELFVAERGGGAFLNGRPIRVSDASTLVESMLVTGFPVRHSRAHSRDRRTVRRVRRPRSRGEAPRIGGARPLLRRGGRMDGFWEQDLKPWDIAAGTIIVEEAGGRVTDFVGRSHLLSPAAAAGHQRQDPRRHGQDHEDS